MMRRIFLSLCMAFIASASFAQSSPGLYYGQVPTAAQWNSYFAAKQDVFGAKTANTIYAGPTSGTAATPTFRSMVVGDLPSIAANKVLANVTGSAAVPTAASLPSCADTGGNRLNYVSGSGFVCGTGTTGTVTSVGLSMPSVFSVSGSPVTSSGTLAVTANGTSGGIPYFNAANTMASSAALAANQIVLGGGAGATPATLGSLGTTTQVLHGNAAGAPTWSAVSLTADVSGLLPSANGGTTGFTTSAPLIGGGVGAVATAGTRSGNTTTFVTTTGAQTSGNCVTIDASGNHVAASAGCATISNTTWTPTFAASSGSATYTVQQGSYAAIPLSGGGHFVHVEGSLRGDPNTLSGAMYISGLPYTIAAASVSQGACAVGPWQIWTLTAGYTAMVLQPVQNTTTLEMAIVGSAQTYASVTPAMMGSSSFIRFTCTYISSN